MAEHTWTEGSGLTNGLPEFDWPMRKLITVYPYMNSEFDSHPSWKVQICWGDTWGHIAFGRSEEFTEAMRKACENAVEEGCPPEWLPLENMVFYEEE